MVKVELRGIAKVKAKGHAYYYAWRGGPRLVGEPGSPEFMASYNEAVESRHTPVSGKFTSLVTLYRASNDYKKLAESTRKAWSPWLDRIADYFGELRLAQFDRPQKIRPIIRRWRNQWSDRPRTADYGMQVLSRVLSHAVDPLGKIAGNATKFYIAELPIRVIAEVLAWSEDQVERIIRRYVERAAATKAAIRQINEARKRT